MNSNNNENQTEPATKKHKKESMSTPENQTQEEKVTQEGNNPKSGAEVIAHYLKSFGSLEKWSKENLRECLTKWIELEITVGEEERVFKKHQEFLNKFASLNGAQLANAYLEDVQKDVGATLGRKLWKHLGLDIQNQSYNRTSTVGTNQGAEVIAHYLKTFGNLEKWSKANLRECLTKWIELVLTVKEPGEEEKVFKKHQEFLNKFEYLNGAAIAKWSEQSFINLIGELGIKLRQDLGLGIQNQSYNRTPTDFEAYRQFAISKVPNSAQYSNYGYPSYSSKFLDAKFATDKILKIFEDALKILEEPGDEKQEIPTPVSWNGSRLGKTRIGYESIKILKQKWFEMKKNNNFHAIFMNFNMPLDSGSDALQEQEFLLVPEQWLVNRLFSHLICKTTFSKFHHFIKSEALPSSITVNSIFDHFIKIHHVSPSNPHLLYIHFDELPLAVEKLVINSVPFISVEMAVKKIRAMLSGLTSNLIVLSRLGLFVFPIFTGNVFTELFDAYLTMSILCVGYSISLVPLRIKDSLDLAYETVLHEISSKKVIFQKLPGSDDVSLRKLDSSETDADLIASMDLLRKSTPFSRFILSLGGVPGWIIDQCLFLLRRMLNPNRSQRINDGIFSQLAHLVETSRIIAETNPIEALTRAFRGIFAVFKEHSRKASNPGQFLENAFNQFLNTYLQGLEVHSKTHFNTVRLTELQSYGCVYVFQNRLFFSRFMFYCLIQAALPITCNTATNQALNMLKHFSPFPFPKQIEFGEFELLIGGMVVVRSLIFTACGKNVVTIQELLPGVEGPKELLNSRVKVKPMKFVHESYKWDDTLALKGRWCQYLDFNFANRLSSCNQVDIADCNSVFIMQKGNSAIDCRFTLELESVDVNSNNQIMFLVQAKSNEDYQIVSKTNIVNMQDAVEQKYTSNLQDLKQTRFVLFFAANQRLPPGKEFEFKATAQTQAANPSVSTHPSINFVPPVSLDSISIQLSNLQMGQATQITNQVQANQIPVQANPLLPTPGEVSLLRLSLENITKYVPWGVEIALSVLQHEQGEHQQRTTTTS